MNYRQLGNTGLEVSSLGFGCGAVGGLLVRGEYSEMVRTVARAIEEGVTYFDTAALYGNGVSEENLGRVLRELKAEVVVGTKVRLDGADLDDIRASVMRSVDASLKRLQMERVDLFQLHNPVATKRNRDREWVTVEDVAAAVDAFEDLARQGKVGAWGINGLGETKSVHHVVAQRNAQTIQVCYNLLNPSARMRLPASFPFQDYDQLIGAAVDDGMGVIAIRVLAGGALSGVQERHPLGASAVDPIASGASYADDVRSADKYRFLVDVGYADNLIEAAIRFAVYTPGISTALVGISSYEQLEAAVTYAKRGPLDDQALAEIARVNEADTP